MTPSRRDRVTAEVDLGTAELIPDPRRHAGWALYVDGVAQSYVDLEDPTYLEFGYVRRVAAVIDAIAPVARPLDVLHLGGGALCLPRYVHATRPGSRQIVVDADAALWDLVVAHLPPPAEADIRVRITGARAEVASTPAGAYDLIIVDAFQGGEQPPDLISVEFAGLAARALRATGLFVQNVMDLPALAFTRRQCATLRQRFADVGVVGEAGMLRGRRYGNSVLVASTRPGGLPVHRMARSRPGDDAPTGLLHGTDLDGFIAGARPVTDDTAEDALFLERFTEPRADAGTRAADGAAGHASAGPAGPEPQAPAPQSQGDRL
jgi:spermidine synthase